MKKDKLKKVLSIALAVAMVIGTVSFLPQGTWKAYADTVSEEKGAFTVTAETQADLDAVTYNEDDKLLTFGAGTAGKSFTVKQTSGVDTATSDRMVVKDIAADKPVTITLEGVNIASPAAAMQIEGSSAVNLVLKDESKNTLRAGGECAGLDIQANASIIISGNTGSLTVAGSSDGAGIGSRGYDKTGTIDIRGGIITANGGYLGAGIGCGKFGDNGTIDIRGGIITANGGTDGTGIGSGFLGKNGTINISGGTVTATGSEFAAGIGGTKDAGEINITGGTVTATGNNGGAGIGGCNCSPGGTVNISGGTVTAYGGDEAAGIGGGYGGNGGVVNISEGTVTAIGGNSQYWDEDHYYSGGSGIGSGGTHLNQKTTTGATLKISNKATVIAASTGERPAITTDGDITETEGGTVANIIQADFASVLPMDTTVEVKDKLCESLGTKLAYNVTKDYLKTIAFSSPEISSETVYTLAVTPKDGEARNQQNGPDDNAQVAFTTLDGGIADFTNVKDTELWPLVVGDKVDGYKAGEEVSVTAESDSEGREFAKWIVVRGDITLENETSTTASFTMPASVVELSPNYVDKTYSISSSVANLDFSYTAGDTAIQSKKISITNTGNAEVTCSCNALTNFTVTDPDDGNTLVAGTTKTWTVVPNSNLKAGTYNETLTVSTDHDTSVTIPLKVVVKAAAAPTPEPAAPTPRLNFHVKAGATKVTLNWNKVKGADGYYIYGNKCGPNSVKKIKTIKKSDTLTWTQKNLKKGKTYKYKIQAYKKTANGTKILKTSVMVHEALTGSKYTNAKKVTANFTTATLKKGKTKQIKAKIIKQNPKKKLVSHEDKFRYRTNNSKVATVSKSGKIKAVGKGKCNIYVYANNGVYKKLTITVNM